jgi:hypothetical protein
MADEQIYHTIRQLFAMAEHATSNEHEAAVALEKAQALLFKHNLSRATIGDIDNGPTTPGMGQVTITEEHGYTWRKRLLHVIAKNNLCQTIGSPQNKGIHVFGGRDNVRAVLEMYYWLAEQVIKIAGPGYKEYKRQGGDEAARTWNAGFYVGAINTLGERLRKPLEEFSQGQGHAIVKVNNTALTQAVRRVFPHTQKARGTTRMGDGFFSGRQAGHNVTLGQARPISSGRPALSGR